MMVEKKSLITIVGGPEERRVVIDGDEYSIVNPGQWEKVEGGRGVKCRTWEVKGKESKMDGADIVIEAGGYTPVQLVEAAEVVIDIPETGSGYSCVRDTDGQIYINPFGVGEDDQEGFQMICTPGMVMVWVAITKMELTEYERPPFSQGMFTTIPDNTQFFRGMNLEEYWGIVNDLKKIAEFSQS